MTRADCHKMSRPCPYVTCKWHVLHVYNPDWVRKASDEEIIALIRSLPDTCILDFCDRGEGQVNGCRPIGVLLGVSHVSAWKFIQAAELKIRRMARVVGYG